MVINSSRRLRVAVQVAPEHADYAAIRQAALAADELGADVVFNWDHFFPLGKVREGRHFECWTMLGAWAESTSRAEIGALVSCNSYRNPDLLADMARTVDHISGGRLILGLGAGFREWEYTQYGYEFGTPRERVQDLATALQRIEQRLAVLNPVPTRKVPILVAGGGPKTLRLVAQHADIWHTFAEGDDLGHKSQVLDQYCRELGREPDAIERSTFVKGDPWEVGPRYRDHGITLFTIFTSGPHFDLNELRRWIAWRDDQNGR
ncbi:LLM class F420-dependent oxidoreductase [Kineosporia babensis]|uniref:LLM class F420-dependent oxidoreductase n=1 Tax=Kineosporia babensis TaxID=499548 RepID=A0A9X1SVJ5_9ACTN|nr:LLM class F420-dependent oxidoreductase [Kineosporia babensis]MCD5314067.1 LLM class F420-dependent oxidoreductase [Kineosporia babensis]